MVKIERLQEWAALDKCLSVMGKRLFCLIHSSHATLFDDDL